MPILITLAVGAVIGGFAGGLVGGETFSVVWAVVGAVATLAAAFLLGRHFHLADQKKRDQELPPEIRAVFDRMLGADSTGGIPRAKPRPSGASTTQRRPPTPAEDPLGLFSADPLRATVERLARERAAAVARGEHPETMLVPHNRLKLDVMVKAYEHDLHRAIADINSSAGSASEKAAEIARCKKDVATLIYRLKRESSTRIISLFDEMRAARDDLAALEAQVRAENPMYSLVKEV